MNAEDILHRYKLSVTTCRQDILECLLSAEGALSEEAIKQFLHEKHDRTTFYRTFKTFLKKNIIHSIVTENEVKYALTVRLPDESDDNGHMHFECNCCGELLCLPNVRIGELNLPKGYAAQSIHILVKGVCEHCPN